MEDRRNSRIIYKEIILLFLFAIALKTRQELMILALAYIFICVLRGMPINEIMAVSIFCVPFANVFKLSLGTISLLSIIQIVFIAKYILNYCEHGKLYIVSTKYLVLWIFIVFVTIINGNMPFMRFINFFIFFVMIFIEENTPDDSKMLIYGQSFALGTVSSCVIGYFKNAFPNVLQFISSVDAMRDGNEVYGRFMGLTEDPNILSAFIIFSIAIVITLYFSKKIQLWLFAVETAALVFFGMQTYSKMFLLGVAVLFLVTSLIYAKRDSIGKLLFLVAALLLTVLIAYQKGLFDSFITVMQYRLGTTSSQDFSSGRFDIWLRYYSSMNERIFSWVIGYGIRGGMLSYKASHNSFIQIFYSLGLVGFFGYLACIKETVWSKNRITLLLLFAITWSALSVDVFDQDYFYYILIIIAASKRFYEGILTNE